MQIVPRYYVQSTDDYTFLRADGEGGVDSTPLIVNATPFSTPEAAVDAVQDHCAGEAVVFRTYEIDRA